QKGVKMYGAYWCPHCSEQKELFDAAFKYAPYVECGVPGDTSKMLPVCSDAQIKHFPTWQFPPVGERVEGVESLDDLSFRTGCPLQWGRRGGVCFWRSRFWRWWGSGFLRCRWTIISASPRRPIATSGSRST